jgi:membrane-bound serine protease (ClpP class)
MPRFRTVAWHAAVVIGVACAVASDVSAQDGPTRPVLATTVAGPITPVIAGHINDGIARAERDGASAYLIELDTPGGLDTSMRAIVQDILASEVPVIVYISPQGARGASAGAIIAFSAHVAAMAPGTTIGAATPVSGQGGDDLDAKVVNDAIAYATALAELRGRDVEFISDTVRDGRSASASEALELGAIDVVATSVDELLQAIDGTTVEVGQAGRQVRLDTAGAIVVQHEMGVLRTIQQFLADPNVAFLLLSIGTLGLIYELASPGLGAGGAVGVTFIVLAMFGLAVLPVGVVGIMFLLLAGALFVAEVAAPGIGVAAAGGALAMVLSGIFLIDDAPGIEISAAVIVPSALVVGVFVVVAGRIAMRSRVAPSSTTGPGLFVGQHATVRLSGSGPQVFIQGAWWGVRPAGSDEVVADGSQVEVVAMDGLTLVVDTVSVPAGVIAEPGDVGEPQ